MPVNEDYTSEGQSSASQAYDGNAALYKAGYPHTTTHDYDPGVLVLPVASATSRTIKVRLHGGYGIRRVAFDVAREDNPPIIPKPEDVVTDERTDVLTACTLDMPLPYPSPTSGQLTWRVVGEYTFVSHSLKTTSTKTEVALVSPGVPPVPPTTVTTTSYTKAARVPGKDLLPLGGYPFSLGAADAIAAGVYSVSGTNLKAYSVTQTPLTASDKHVWPFPVYPPFAFNGDLLKEI